MTNREAIKGLERLAKEFSGYKPNEEMFEMAINALTKEAWKEEHPVSPLLQKLATNLQPCKQDDLTAQSEKRTQERTETHSCDCISRQDAIDIERRATVDTNPKHFESHQKFVEFMDNAEISSFGRWQWSNGFNTALTAVGIDLKRLPSAQPEIIQCNDCVYAADDEYQHCPYVTWWNSKDDFCSKGKRRTDG